MSEKRDIFFRLQNRLAFAVRKKIKKKYILIESDDWGLERAIDANGIAWAEKKYSRSKFSRWTTDAMETAEDMGELFNLLESFKTKFEKPPVLTANFITHQVLLSDVGIIQYIPLSKRTSSLKQYYTEGIKKGYIFPQYHGFTHYNTTLLEAYSKTPECFEAYQNGFMLAKSTIRGNLNFLHGELSSKNLKAEEQFRIGMGEFKNVFGFDSVSLIPPTYILDRNYFNLLSASSVAYLQAANYTRTSGRKFYIFPVLRKRKGILWGIRNARLDPHPDYNFEFEQCLESIERAFRHQLPAIIDFHRVNFSGKYAPEYRDKTMQQLKLLFNSIYKRWPDAEFITTPQLIREIYGT